MKEQAKFILIFTVMLMMATGLMSVASAQNSADAYRVDEFDTSGSPVVNVETSGGFVEIIGTDGSEVVSEMFVRQGRRYLSASDTDLSDFNINIEKNGDEVTIRAEQKGNWSHSVFMCLTILLPVEEQAEGM